MVKPQSGFSSTVLTYKKKSTLFALFWPFYGVIFMIYYSKDDTKLQSMCFLQYIEKRERID